MYEQDRTNVTITFTHPLVANADQANQLLGYLREDDLNYSVVRDVTLSGVDETTHVVTVTATIPSDWTVEEFDHALSHGIEYGSRLAQGVTDATVTESSTTEQPTETITEGEPATA